MNELLLEISYACNFKCVHCSSVDCKGRVEPEFLEKFLKEHKEINMVRISGGEPLAYYNLEPYLEILNNNNIYGVLQTNGHWHFIDRIKHTKPKFDEIWFSIYGLDHDNFCNKKDALSAVLNSMRYCKNKRYKIKIQSPIFDFETTKQTKFIADEFKVPVRFTALLNHGRCDFALDIEEQKRIAEKVGGEITCSLSGKCLIDSKWLIKPDMSVLRCASEKHGLKCVWKKVI